MENMHIGEKERRMKMGTEGIMLQCRLLLNVSLIYGNVVCYLPVAHHNSGCYL